MTHRQRKLAREWFFGACFLLALIVFDNFVERNAWWLRIVFMTVGMVALAGRSRFELAAEGRSNLADVVEDAPWLKAWACICGVTIFVAAIYITKHSIDLSSLGLVKVMLVPMAIFMAPFVVLIERQKFIELGEIGRAT